MSRLQNGAVTLLQTAAGLQTTAVVAMQGRQVSGLQIGAVAELQGREVPQLQSGGVAGFRAQTTDILELTPNGKIIRVPAAPSYRIQNSVYMCQYCSKICHSFFVCDRPVFHILVFGRNFPRSDTEYILIYTNKQVL